MGFQSKCCGMPSFWSLFGSISVFLSCSNLLGGEWFEKTVQVLPICHAIPRQCHSPNGIQQHAFLQSCKVSNTRQMRVELLRQGIAKNIFKLKWNYLIKQPHELPWKFARKTHSYCRIPKVLAHHCPVGLANLEWMWYFRVVFYKLKLKLHFF